MIVNGDADHVVDWDALRSAAALAYCPYSGLWVGAAGLCDDGRVGDRLQCGERLLLPDAFEL